MQHPEKCTNPPPRGEAGLVLIRDEHGRVLLLEKANQPGPERFVLPGGPADADEPASFACQRHVLKMTGIKLAPQRVLVVHYVPEHGELAERHDYVFDGRLFLSDTSLVLPKEGFRAFRWVDPDDLGDLVAPYLEWRIHHALEAKDGGPIHYLVGYPPAPAAV